MTTIQDTKCSCGRARSPQHCVNCGRKDIYATRRNDRLIIVEGVKYIAKGFRCRKCGAEFDESTQCEAPRRGLSITAQRVEEQAQVSLTGLPDKERKARIAELFGLREKKQDEKS